MSIEPYAQPAQAIEPWQQQVPTNLPRAAAALVEWARAASAAHALAESLCKTNFVPQTYRGKPDEATAAILAGAEVGLSPMAALAGFDMISGSAYPKAMTLRAVLLAQGHEIVIDVSTPTTAKGRGRRYGSSEWQHAEWTIARARQMGLIGKSIPAKDPWVKQPTNMLVARLTSELSRMVAADAILGIAYSAEEMQDSLGAQVAPVSSPRQRVTMAAQSPATTVADTEPPSSPAEPPAPSGDADTPAADAEPPADQPAPAPVQLISQPQQRLLHKLLRDRKMNRDDGLTHCSEIVGRPIESTADLTVAEAGQCIESLQPAGAGDEPPL